MVILLVAVMLLSTPLTALYTISGIGMNPSRWKRFFPFFVLTIFMLSHAFMPKITSLEDIVRYFAAAEDIAKLSSLSDVIAYSKDGLFVKNIYFWIAGSLNDPHLLPAISNSIVYGVSTYIIMDTADREGMTKWIPYALLVQPIVLPFTAITCNIRNVCAFSLIVLATYLEMVKGKHGVGVMLLYVLPCFLHFSGIVILLCRIIAGLTKKYGLVGVFILLLFPLLLKLAYSNLSLFALAGNLGKMLQYGISKTFNYIDNESISIYELHVQNSIGNAIRKLIMMSIATIVFAQGYWYYKRSKEKNNSPLYVFLLLLCAMVVTCRVFIAPHYWRFYCAMIIISPIVLFPMWKNRKNIPFVLKVSLYLVPILACGIFALDFRSFIIAVDMPEFFAATILDNIYYVIFNAIRSLI